jgi:hypothetical protein
MFKVLSEEVFMQVVKRSLGGAIIVTILFLWAGLTQAAEFTANVVTKSGGKEIPGKVYVKGQKARHEIKIAGQTNIQILRPDKNLIWVVIPQQKAYMEMPLTRESQEKMFLNVTEKQKAKMKKVGTETVNNFACDKYETTLTHQGKPTKFYIWIATDLGTPIKLAAQDGSFSSECKDIKTGGVSDSLFEPPQGYKKIKIPMPIPSVK